MISAGLVVGGDGCRGRFLLFDFFAGRGELFSCFFKLIFRVELQSFAHGCAWFDGPRQVCNPRASHERDQGAGNHRRAYSFVGSFCRRRSVEIRFVGRRFPGWTLIDSRWSNRSARRSTPFPGKFGIVRSDGFAVGWPHRFRGGPADMSCRVHPIISFGAGGNINSGCLQCDLLQQVTVQFAPDLFPLVLQ